MSEWWYNVSNKILLLIALNKVISRSVGERKEKSSDLVAPIF